MRDRRPARFTEPWTWAGPSLLARSPRPTEISHRRCRCRCKNIGFRLQPLTSVLHQRGSALTDFLKRHFEAAKFLRAQIREHFPHLPGMLSEGWNNEIPAARCER